MEPCEICGNPVPPGASRCPYCGAARPFAAAASDWRSINLEQGRPATAAALRKLSDEIVAARMLGIKFVKIIHGYGSSGKGGAIRLAVRRALAGMRQRGEVAAVLPGEQFGPADAAAARLARRQPKLAADPDWGRANPGITMVLLR